MRRTGILLGCGLSGPGGVEGCRELDRERLELPGHFGIGRVAWQVRLTAPQRSRSSEGGSIAAPSRTCGSSGTHLTARPWSRSTSPPAAGWWRRDEEGTGWTNGNTPAPARWNVTFSRTSSPFPDSGVPAARPATLDCASAHQHGDSSGCGEPVRRLRPNHLEHRLLQRWIDQRLHMVEREVLVLRFVNIRPAAARQRHR